MEKTGSVQQKEPIPWLQWWYCILLWPAPWVSKMKQTLHCDWLPEHAIWPFIKRLALWRGKMNQILHCDWLPEQAIWPFIKRLALWGGKMNQILHCDWMAGYWPRPFVELLWMLILSLSTHKTHTKISQYSANLTSCLVNNPNFKMPSCKQYLASFFACLGGITCCVPQEKVFFPYNKSFIGQSCAVKTAGFWYHSFFRFYRTGPYFGQ